MRLDSAGELVSFLYDIISRLGVDTPVDDIEEKVCQGKDYSGIGVDLVTVVHDMVDTLAD